MTGEERKGGGGGGERTTTKGNLTSTDNANNVTNMTNIETNVGVNQQNGGLDKAPVVVGTNVETLPRPEKQGDSSTFFLRAARAGHLEKVLEYLDMGVDINASNANGLNALHLAAKDGHLEIVKELLTRGAIVDAATKKGNTALHIASLAGQEDVVQLLVQNGASVNAQSQNGFTPLYMAAQENHDSVVKFLLNKGANQSLATEDGFTPLAVAMQQGHDKVVAVLLENCTRGKIKLPALHIAAKKDDCKAATLLLQSDHNVDVVSKSGFTPLHIAAHYGNDRIASILCDKGADVNFVARHNITPMHVAAKWGKIKMVNFLISKGAQIAVRTRDGLTPLHCAARSGHHEVVDILVEKGAPIGSKSKSGLAPLHMSVQGDHVDATRILLYHRAPVDEVTVDYLTPLHVAAHCGHVRVAKLLLDRNADKNARALNGFTPLHIACKKNRFRIIELLLKYKASIEATTESGLTPLHVASFMGGMNIVIYLLQHDANPDIPTVRGETPLHLAARANQTDIIRILLRNGAQVDAHAREEQTPLHIASRLGNVDIVMLLLQHGATVDATTNDSYTSLHIAAKEGQEEVASVLLENGASLTAPTKKGFTPLHLAAKYGNMNVARLLLQKNAPIDAEGKNGVTPLHMAAYYDHQNVALLLLDKGASPHGMAKNGNTPLHIAAWKNQMDIATTLLEYGAKTNVESKGGFVPIHLSALEGHTDMTTLLIEHKGDLNHRAKNGITPIHFCAQEDHVNVASILVKNGSHIDEKTNSGYTPLHIAAHFGQAAMVRFLLSSGASVDSRTNVGYTPLHQAAQQGHTQVINLLLENKAQPNVVSHNGYTALDIGQKLGYISVVETLKVVTETVITTTHTINIEEKYKVQVPEYMQEAFMSDSEEEGGEDPMLNDLQQYQYMTGDDMKSMGDDSMRVNVTDDERDNRHSGAPTITEMITKESYNRQNAAKPDNIDINRHPVHVGFLVSFLVDARGGAMRGCRHSGVRVIVPPRKATMPMRVTCRYLKRDKLTNPPPLMEGEALASRILELGPVDAKFLGPVIIEVPHFASLRGKEREIVILRSDNGETWREHTLEASEEAVQDVLNESFEGEELSQLEDLQTSRIVRILTVDFPHYFAVVSRIRQEVHAVGPEGGTVSSSAVPQVQAIFPAAALTKKIRVGLQAHPIPTKLVAKLLGNRVAVSPIVTVEPRRRKFHKPIILTIPVPQAANKGMINQYSGDAPTLRLLCSITGGQSRAVWEDVTGSTPLTFVKDCVSFTTTVSARFWLMDCRNISEATKMATELYTHATHVPFMAKFVVFAKRVDPLEARLRVFCMTDDKEDKTLEHQEHFTEVAKSRDVEVLEGKTQYMEFGGNLVPVLKSGEQLQLPFRAFKENRVPFTARVKDPDAADMMGRIMFMNEPKVAKGEPPQTPICTLNILLPEKISPKSGNSELDLLELSKNYSFPRDRDLSRPEAIHRATIRMTDIANLLDEDWEKLAKELNISSNEISQIKEEYPDKTAQQATAMFKVWQSNGNKATGNTLEKALNKIGREDIVKQCIFNVELVTDDIEKAVARVRLDQPGFDSLKEELGPSRNTSLRRDATMDPKMDPDYEEPDRMKHSEYVEDLRNTGDKKTTKQHATITNGTVYNATSTPIKNKYASDEKDLGDMMADFIENKYHTADTMVKKSRDEIDDDNKKRQRVLADANKIVSGVKQDAEKEMGKLATEGWSVVSNDDVRKNNEVGYVIKQQKHALLDDPSVALEPPIIQQQCIVGTNGDRTITTITTKTIITTARNNSSKENFDNKGAGYDIKPTSTDTNESLNIDRGNQSSEKPIFEKSKVKPFHSEALRDLEFNTQPKQNTLSNVKDTMLKVEKENSQKPTSRSVLSETNGKEISSAMKEKTNAHESTYETLPDQSNQPSAYEIVYNAQDSVRQEERDDSDNEGKRTKDKSSGIFSAIFKTPKLKKDKSKDSKEISFESIDQDPKIATIKILEDMKMNTDLTHYPENTPVEKITDIKYNREDLQNVDKNIKDKRSDKQFTDNSKEKTSGFFGIFKNPKLKSKSRSSSKEKHSSNEISFDSGDEETRNITTNLLQDIKQNSDYDDQVQRQFDTATVDKNHSGQITEKNRKTNIYEQNIKKDLKENSFSDSDEKDNDKSTGFLNIFKSPRLKNKKTLTGTQQKISNKAPIAPSEVEKKISNTKVLEDNKKAEEHDLIKMDMKTATQMFLEDSRNIAGINDACPYKTAYLYQKSIQLENQQIQPNKTETQLENRKTDGNDKPNLSKYENNKEKNKHEQAYPKSNKEFDLTAKTTKKIKDETSQDTSSIIKNAKYTAENTIDDIKEFPETTQTKVITEGEKAKQAADKAIKEIEDSASHVADNVKKGVDTVGTKITTTEKKLEKGIDNLKDQVDETGRKAADKVHRAVDDVKDKTKDVKDKVSDTAQDVKDKTEQAAKDVTDSTSAALKKGKEKTGGFFSGIYKDAKHAAEDVADEVKEFSEETKQEAMDEEEKAKRAADKAVKDIEDSARHVADNVKKGVDTVETKITTTEKKLDKGIDNLEDQVDETGRKVADKVHRALYDVKDKTKDVKDKVLYTAQDVKDKTEQAAKDVTESTSTAVKKGKDKTGGFFSGILKGAKHAATEVADDVREFVEDTKQEAIDEEIRTRKNADKSITFIKERTNNFSNDGTTNGHNTATKVVSTDSYLFNDHLKKKSNQFDENVSKPYNQTVTGIPENVTDLYTVHTPYHASEERLNNSEPLSSNESYRTIEDKDSFLSKKTDSLDLTDTRNTTIVFLEDARNTATITSDPFPTIPSSTSSESSSTRNSLERDLVNKNETEKSKRTKKGGVMSSIVKKARGATHKIVKEVDHAAEGFKDATEKFWEDTKKESRDSRPSGSYDVTPSINDLNKVKHEVTLEPDIIPGSSNICTTNVIRKVESRIPQDNKSYQELQRSDIQIREELITIVESDVSSSLLHSEPHAHQTVTTVITKSVRTASTPPPSSTEFTDNSSKDITQEAAKRAQILSDHTRSLIQTENDFLQQSEPSFMETITTETSPDTHERITRVTRTITSSVPITGEDNGENDDLRESMKKMVDQFMVEERKSQ